MGEKLSKIEPGSWYGEGLISALSVGGVLVLIGTVFVINPHLLQNIIDFSKDLSTVKVSGTSILLPAPTMPSAHTGLYIAAAQFELGLGILQVVILAARLLVKSRIRRVAGTAGSLVFWFGAAYLTETFLNSSATQESWFSFWAAIVVLFGVSIIVRAIVFSAVKAFK